MPAIRRRFSHHFAPILLLLLTWGTYFIVLFTRILSWRPDGLYLGSVNTWSDWALHITLANRFALLAPKYWFASHPLYAGAPMNYPFFSDFISGMLMRTGLSLKAAMVAPSVITALALLLLAYAVLYRLLRSAWQAVLAISIFFLSAGYGFLHMHFSWANLLSPPLEYSRFDAYQWYSGNTIVGLLLPQRGMLLGMAWTLGILYIVITALQSSDISKARFKLLIAGILAGFLPIIHPHSLIALAVFSLFLCLPRWRDWRSLIWYALPATIISLIFYKIFIASGFHLTDFMGWHPGLGIPDFKTWISQWFYWRWGLMLPLVILSYIALRRSYTTEARRIFQAAATLFVLASLISFQPTFWDNSKILYWAYFFFSAMAVAVLADMWRTGRLLKVMAVICVFLLTATGTLELIRLQRIDLNSYQETSSADIALGDQIRQQTDPGAVFLTANAHNDFVMIWGLRSVYLGFVSWVENYGFPSSQRYNDSWNIYQGGAQADRLIAQDRISYVIIGPGETYSFHPDQTYFDERFPVAFSNDSNRVYDVRSVWR